MKLLLDTLKRLPPLFYIIIPYVSILPINAAAVENGNAASAIPAEITMLAFTLNLIWPFIMKILNMNGKQVLFWGMLIKLFYIPVFVINFVLGLICFLSMHLIFMAVIMFLYDIVLMIPSGLYVLSGALRARKEGNLKTVEAVLCILLQFIFVLDVVAAIYAFVRTKSNKEKIEKEAQITG